MGCVLFIGADLEITQRYFENGWYSCLIGVKNFHGSERTKF